ncbi:hypothetical protein DdX_07782 [Ditylenchus destructor]|uniref:Uncharacterized protein n=1 Tax=Ditylenchus destructor TaxID=166010 RepID=A0AAD4R7L6_9BILA|nr:hypothetical protein DdX_07782 [Ditylenchus destructor]
MHRPSTASTRKQSIVEAAEAHFDKNTIILFVNVLILIVLVAILYVIATSAMNASGVSSTHSTGAHHKAHSDH